MTITELAKKHDIEPDSAIAFLRDWLDEQTVIAYLHEWAEMHAYGDTYVPDYMGQISRESTPFAENDSITPLIARPTLGE